MKIAIFIFLALFSTPAFADLNSEVESILESPRGPFAPHVLQSETDRRLDDGSSSGYLFRVAFRSPEAQSLARNQNLYLGNLFTTNYYELMGEFVYGDADSNHPVQHALLLAKAREANPRASVMIRNWLLEKHYLRVLPDSNLAKAFAIRSISDYESERGYADYFFDIYLSGMSNEFQFLLASLMVRESPIIDAPSIADARELVGNSYMKMILAWGANDPKTTRLFALRNLIHNQMTKEAIPEIDRFLIEVPEYLQLGQTELSEVRTILAEYYSFPASKLMTIANQLGSTDAQTFQTLAATPKTSAEYPLRLLDASRAIANLKWNLVRNSGFSFTRTSGLYMVSNATQFLAKEALGLAHPNSDTVRILLNSVYAEGFLIHENYVYFNQQIDEASTPAEIKTILNDVADIAQTTLSQAMASTPAVWAGFEPRLENFSDTVVKSSSLNALSVFANRIR